MLLLNDTPIYMARSHTVTHTATSAKKVRNKSQNVRFPRAAYRTVALTEEYPLCHQQLKFVCTR